MRVDEPAARTRPATGPGGRLVESVEDDRHVAGDEILHRRAGPAIGDMLDVGLGQDLEQFTREMMGGAGAGGAVVQFTRIGFGIGDELGERLGGDLVWIDDHHLRRPRDQRHSNKVFLEIVVEVGIERGGDGVMRRAHEEGVAVRRGL